MSELHEVLGHLLCEITRARVAADLEAVRVAKQYAEDPDGLLRHFPIPRMRMPEVELTLPVVVSFVPEGYISKISPDQLLASLTKNLKDGLLSQKIQVNTADIKRLINADPNLGKGYLEAGQADFLSKEVFESVRKSVEKKPMPLSPEESAKRLELIVNIIRDQVGRTLDSLPRRPVGIVVDARSQQVRELGPPGICLNLKVSVKEDGLDMIFEDAEEGRASPPPLKSLTPE